jgi:hypothetical protein
MTFVLPRPTLVVVVFFGDPRFTCSGVVDEVGDEADSQPMAMAAAKGNARNRANILILIFPFWRMETSLALWRSWSYRGEVPDLSMTMARQCLFINTGRR